MKIPSKPSEQTTLEFENEFTEWFDFRGRRKNRNLFVVTCERSHADCFVNPHHDITSFLFDCNTNVATGVDGGSVFYMTCYVSKNTFEEDSDHFNKAAYNMAKKMNESIAEQTTSEESDADDNDILSEKKRD